MKDPINVYTCQIQVTSRVISDNIYFLILLVFYAILENISYTSAARPAETHTNLPVYTGRPSHVWPARKPACSGFELSLVIDSRVTCTINWCKPDYPGDDFCQVLYPWCPPNDNLQDVYLVSN